MFLLGLCRMVPDPIKWSKYLISFRIFWWSFHCSTLHEPYRNRDGLASYSPDINPCDFFLCRQMKVEVYLKKPQTFASIEHYVCHGCQLISTDTLSRVSANFVLKLGHIISAKGGYFKSIVFSFLAVSSP